MWPKSRHFMIALIITVFVPHHAASQALATQNPYKVEAAFLRNFAHYVDWPVTAFPNSSAPWQIVILGPDPFGDVLEKTLKDRTEKGRSFEVHRTDSIEHLPDCQILYVAYKDAGKRQSALKALRGKPVLTVSDAPGFMMDGGIIQLKVEHRVWLRINLDRAREASLSIQTKMLEVASEVLDEGMIRKVK